MLLLFLHADAPPEWWQLDAAGRILARGAGTPPPAVLIADTSLIVVPPADSVSLHRITLPNLAPAQAQAAARLMASELAAAPIETLHTAIGSHATDPGADGQRWLAITSADAMAGWLASLDAMGLAPAALVSAALVPAPLLLPADADSAVAWPLGPLLLVRAAMADGQHAFAAEPELAEALLRVAPRLLDAEAVAKHAVRPPALDLLQGRFARRQPWRAPPGQLRRLAVLAASAALLLVAGDAARLWQATRAADAAAQTRDSLAATLLPPGTPVTDARAQVVARAASASAGGFSRLAAPLLAALESRPGVSLAALEADATSLSAALETASPGDVAAITAALEATGLSAVAGLPRGSAGLLQIELKVSRR
jgi:general secretion pathway protein L